MAATSAGRRRPSSAAAAPPAPRVFTFRRIVVTTLLAFAILVGSLAGVFLAFESDLPQVTSLEEFQPNIITQVFAADGSVLGEFAIEKRIVVAFRDIPPVLRNAIVAVEDADFWKHLGINFWRIPGAALANLRSGRRGQGFSTLTMQLTRLLFLTPEKTYERKIKEGILAFQIEKNFTKEEILTLYCNQIYFGHGNYGVEAASRFFFSKPVRDLTLHRGRAHRRDRAGRPRGCRRSRTPSARSPAATTCSTAWPRRSTSAARRPRPRRGSPSACACAASRRRSRRTSSRRCASTSSASTAASASTRAACASTRRSTPCCSAPPSARCATACACSTAAPAASSRRSRCS